MRTEKLSTDANLIAALLSGGVAVLRTDTIYGLVARAEDEAAVERLYTIKHRDDDKPSIVLVSSYDQLFDVPSPAHQVTLEAHWPGPVSVILPSQQAPPWISRGGMTVAYRMPKNDDLLALLRETGPLVAPSANPQSKPPARSIEQARQYFGEMVDYYHDGGAVDDPSPSQLLRLSLGGGVERLR